MRSIFTILVVVSSILMIRCSENKQEVSENQLAGMRTTAKEYMKDLKGILVEQIKTGGVLQAVSVCSDTAQILTNEFGLTKGLFIKRVSQAIVAI